MSYDRKVTWCRSPGAAGPNGASQAKHKTKETAVLSKNGQALTMRPVMQHGRRVVSVTHFPPATEHPGAIASSIGKRFAGKRGQKVFQHD